MTSLTALSVAKTMPSTDTRLTNAESNVVFEPTAQRGLSNGQTAEDDDDDHTDTSSMGYLWDMDGDMTAEQISAALAEEKKRKKVRHEGARGIVS